MDSGTIALIITILVAVIGGTWKLSEAIYKVRDEVHEMVGKFNDHEIRIKDLEKEVWDK